jgi:transcription initiation factor TFIIF subunit beta
MNAGNKQGVGSSLGTVEEAIELGVKHAGRRVWLIKVPEFVGKEWREACEHGGSRDGSSSSDDDSSSSGSGEDDGNETGDQKKRTKAGGGSSVVLGKLKIGTAVQGGQDVTKVTLCVDRKSSNGETVCPECYDMKLNTNTNTNANAMMVFTESEEGLCRSVDGMVQHRLDVDPSSLVRQGSDRYRKITRERFQGEAVSAGRKRTIQVMKDSKIVDIRKPIGVEDVWGRGQKKKKAAAQLEKRVAMDSGALMALLFRLFQKQSRWNFSQLQKETDQPTQHLKNVLMEIAKQNKAGPYKDLWELKKESSVFVSPT